MEAVTVLAAADHVVAAMLVPLHAVQGVKRRNAAAEPAGVLAAVADARLDVDPVPCVGNRVALTTLTSSAMAA